MELDGHLLWTWIIRKQGNVSFKKEKREKNKADDYRDLVKRWWKVAFRIFTTFVVYVPLDVTDH